MKKIKYCFSTLLLCLLIHTTPSISQERTFETIVADVLNEMPARDQNHLIVLMEDLAGTGQAGVEKLISMIIPAEHDGNDSKVRYALGGLAFYLSENNLNAQKQWFTRTLVEALKTYPSKEVKAYLMGLLQIAGTSYAAAQLASLANDPELCDPAVRALVGIHTPETEQHLISALRTKDVVAKTAVVQGLGDFRSKNAVTNIRKIKLNSDDYGLKKACLYALSNIPDPGSEGLLKSSAEAVKFQYDPTNATGSFLRFIDRMGETGEPEVAMKLSRYLIENCLKPENMPSKIAGLNLLVKYGGEEVFDDLLMAVDHPKKKFRAAALKLALSYRGESYTEAWIKELKTSDSSVKDEIISMLGKLNDPLALEAILSELDHSDESVRHAALVAAGRIDPQKTLEIIVGELQHENQDMELIAEIIRWLRTDDGSGILYENYTTFTPAAKSMVLHYLTEKNVPELWALVFSETSNMNSEISNTAFECLPTLAGPNHLTDILNLMKIDASSPNLIHVQEAAIASLQEYKPPQRGFSILMTAMDEADSTETVKYLPIFAGIGGADALDIIYHEFTSGTPGVQEAAFSALSEWNTPDALPILFLIGKNHESYRDESVSSYVNSLIRFNLTDDQNRLYLEKIFDLANTTELKQFILQTMGRVRTFQSMMYVAPYLHNPDLEQTAARALMNIALPSGDYSGQPGQYTRQCLQQVMNVLTGEESDYDKARIETFLSEMPQSEGFVSMFNGTDLQGWKGLVGNPASRASMNAEELAEAQAKADSTIKENWDVRDGMIVFNGNGQNLVSVKDYANFEMLVDWKISKNGDSGIYLRGTPQVQIWDTSRRDAGAQVGSGGLYNNQLHRSTPLLVADNPIGEWNTFRIKMVGERVTVFLNGELVVDNEILENYWERDKPIYPSGPIELQAHGTDLAFRNIYVRELPQSTRNVLSQEEIENGFVQLFNGENLDGWIGNKTDYIVENGEIVIYPGRGGHGNLFTENEYGDFVFRFEFQLTPGANNGLGIRAPLEGDAAYVGMELQIIDNTAEIYKDLEDYQFHGSVYGVIPAKRGYLKPVGEWNVQEVVARGPHIKVTLNGAVILDGNIELASKDGTIDGNDHPGLERQKGYIGFLGHGSVVRFRNIRIKDLDD